MPQIMEHRVQAQLKKLKTALVILAVSLNVSIKNISALISTCITGSAIDCVWGDWEEWGHCPSGCPEIQNKTRTRTKKIEADFGGEECEGKDFEKKPCSVTEDLNEDISTLKMVKEALEKEIKELKLNNTKLEKDNAELEAKMKKCNCNEPGISSTGAQPYQDNYECPAGYKEANYTDFNLNAENWAKLVS